MIVCHVVGRIGLDGDLGIDERFGSTIARSGALRNARDPLEEPLDRLTISLIHLTLLTLPFRRRWVRYGRGSSSVRTDQFRNRM